MSWEAVQPNTACLTSMAGGGLLSLGGVCDKMWLRQSWVTLLAVTGQVLTQGQE